MMWDEILDEYGETRGNEVVVEIAEKWFRLDAPSDVDHAEDLPNIIKQYSLMNAGRIMGDLDEGLTHFGVENFPIALLTWYVFAKAYTWDDEDATSVDVGKLHAALTQTFKVHKRGLLYDALRETLTTWYVDMLDSFERMAALMESEGDDDVWCYEQSQCARDGIETACTGIMLVQAVTRLGEGYDVLRMMELEGLARDFFSEVERRKSVLAPRADLAVWAHLMCLDISPDPDKWLYVGGDLFDLWYTLARAVHLHRMKT